MNNKAFDVLLGVYDKNNNLRTIIDQIKNAHELSNNELDYKMRSSFEKYTQYEFIDDGVPMGIITCKYMFIFPWDENIKWIKWKTKDKVITAYPCQQKFMQALYEYTLNGEILKIYDND